MVTVIDAQGRTVLDERARLAASGQGLMRVPHLEGLVLCEPIDAFWVRIRGDADPRHEVWWRYDLSSGRGREDWWPRKAISLPDRDGLRLLGATDLPDTTLCLIHWLKTSGHGTRPRSIFCLVDVADAYSVVWSEEHVLEHAPPGHLIEDVASPGHFRFLSDPGGRLLHYQALLEEAPARGWTVRAVPAGRRPRPVWIIPN